MPHCPTLSHRIPYPLAGEGGPTVSSGRVRGRGLPHPLIQLRLAIKIARLRILLPHGEKEGVSKASHPSPARGEGGDFQGCISFSRKGEGLFGQFRSNYLQHPIEISQNFVVPEPDQAKALRLKPRGALSIAFGRMLPTVHLDDQPRLETDKIGYVLSNRHLSPKLRALQLARAQRSPQPTFRIGCGMPHRSGARCEPASMIRHSPLTRSLRDHPLPRRGEGQAARLAS
jgi:hypothetical protein